MYKAGQHGQVGFKLGFNNPNKYDFKKVGFRLLKTQKWNVADTSHAVCSLQFKPRKAVQQCAALALLTVISEANA